MLKLFLPVGWCAKDRPGHSAVDDDLGGIDIRRIVRCKKENNVCYLFRLTKPAQWYAGLQSLLPQSLAKLQTNFDMTRCTFSGEFQLIGNFAVSSKWQSL